VAIPPHLDRNAPLLAGLLLAAYVLLPQLTPEQLGVLVTAVVAPVVTALIQAALSRRQ
jgi:hypothetical protein